MRHYLLHARGNSLTSMESILDSQGLSLDNEKLVFTEFIQIVGKVKDDIA